GLDRDKVLATVVNLLEKSLIRVGNDEYASANGSFGLTTLQDHHARIEGSVIQFRFKGKSGIRHEVEVRDRRLAALVKKCQDLPGQELFQYLDDAGKVHDVTSADVNEYLRRATGRDFTAKDFRTWAGTVLAALALREFQEFDSHAQAKKNVLQAIERVAGRLGNTPVVCRKCYIHPAILTSYLDRTMLLTAQENARREMRRALADLPPEEAAVLALLERRLSETAA
ncbi:MAG: putative topoisomerase, partial [Verrucomicrobiales bacterium]|nr:putative topoisomerase [Verrucomicrobiales bacterium]